MPLLHMLCRVEGNLHSEPPLPGCPPLTCRTADVSAAVRQALRHLPPLLHSARHCAPVLHTAAPPHSPGTTANGWLCTAGCSTAMLWRLSGVSSASCSAVSTVSHAPLANANLTKSFLPVLPSHASSSHSPAAVQGKVQHYVFVASAGAYVPDGLHAGHLEGDKRKSSAGHVAVENYLKEEGLPFTVFQPHYIYGPHTAKVRKVPVQGA